MSQKKSIEIEEHILVYDQYGDPAAPPIIMLHGWLSYRGVWEQTAEALQDRYNCIAVDLLGFGESDKPDDADYSIKAQGQRVLQLADTLGFERFAIMGHSMGGQIALGSAGSSAPERVESIVNISGVISGQLSPYIEKITLRFIALARRFPVLYSIWRALLRYDPLIDEIFKSWFYNINSVPKEDWAMDRDMAFRPELRISAYEAGKALKTFNLSPYLPRIAAPTLTIFGEQDTVVPITDAHLAKEKIPGSHLVLIDNCGHFPMYERSERYLKAVQNFFSDRADI